MSDALPSDIQAMLDRIASSVTDVRLALDLAALVFAAHRTPPRSPAAERQQRYRDRNKPHNESVTATVTEVVTTVSPADESPVNPPLSTEIAVISPAVGDLGGSASGLILSPSPGSGLQKASGLKSSGDRKSDGRLSLAQRYALEPETPEFLVFWERWPKKRQRPHANHAWNEHRPPLDKVLATLDWQLRDPQWTKDGGEYIPNPATWLNGQGWLNEPTRLPQPPPTALQKRTGENLEAMERTAEIARRFAK